MEKETAAECAIREVFEELGIDLTERIDENLVRPESRVRDPFNV
jgi:8-oxo-dGTP pyrophosphatase MutT (NUDIX family)